MKRKEILWSMKGNRHSHFLIKKLFTFLLILCGLQLYSQPIASINFIFPNPACSGEEVQVDLFGSIDTLLLNWGDGSPIEQYDTTPAFGISHYYFNKDTFDIVLIAYSGSLSDTDSAQMIVHNSVDFNFQYIDSCITVNGQSVQFNDQTLEIDTFPRTWDWGDGTYDTSRNPIHSYKNPGTYIVTLSYDVMLTSPFFLFCTARKWDTINISIDTNLFQGINISEQCPCNEYAFSLNNSTANQWIWNLGDTSIIESNGEINYSFSEPGDYIISITPIDTSTNCIYTKREFINICSNDIDTSKSYSNSRWYFGGIRFGNVPPYSEIIDTPNAGINFNTSIPDVLTDGKIMTLEAAATASDPLTEDLLFYTNGQTVWNNNHTVINNGTGLFGARSAAQGALIVPYPGNARRYYIFTANGTVHDGTGMGYYYSIVDLDSSLGNGKVISKNNPLFTGPCSVVNNIGLDVDHEALTGTIKYKGDCEQNAEYWIVIPACKDSFHAYLISDTGISAPVISVYPSDQFSIDSYSSFSPNGKKYAISEYYIGPPQIRIFNFNLNTGELYNEEIISSFGSFRYYSLVFSPNGRYLYGQDSTLVQFDLSASVIEQERVNLGLVPGLHGLYLGIDNKIYGALYNDSALLVINKPDIKGPACDVQPRGFDLNGRLSKIGLQNIVPLYMQDSFNLVLTFDYLLDECSGTINFIDTSCRFIPEDIDITWDFGDGIIETYNELTYPNHQYDSPGQYVVKLYGQKNCYATDTFSTIIFIDSISSNKGISNIQSDTTVDYGEALLIEAYENGNFFTSSEQICSDCPAITITIYSDTVIYYTQQIDSCIISDSIKILVNDPLNRIYIPNAFSPNGDGDNDLFSVTTFSNLSNFEINIYNNRGIKIYTSKNINEVWNGTYKNKKLNQDVYSYHLKATTHQGETISFKGNILLIR